MANDLGQHRYLATVHRPINYEFANEAARLVGTGYDIIDDDLLKFAHQQDDNTVWMLIDTGPLSWIQVGSGSGVSFTLSPEAENILSIVGNVIYLDTQPANTVFAGPESGGDDYPDFRILSHAELYLPPGSHIEREEVEVNLIIPLAVGWNVTDGLQLEWEEDTTAFGSISSNYYGIILPDNKHSAVLSAFWVVPDDIKPSSSITVSALHTGGLIGFDAYGKMEMVTSSVECDSFSSGSAVVRSAAADDLSAAKCLGQGSFVLGAGNIIQFKYSRDGLDGSDTAADIEIGGFLVTYTAVK